MFIIVVLMGMDMVVMTVTCTVMLIIVASRAVEVFVTLVFKEV